MVIQRHKSGKFDGYKETVLRFTWHRRDLVYAQIGVVDYNVAGKITARSIIQGWLNPNWQKIADEVSADYQLTWEEIQNFGVPNNSSQP
jgi:hypothetical protein